MSEFQPDLTLAYRCISVHWSLPVQCERDKSHADNWHWARHPDTGRAIRYRRTLGVYRTEEVGADAAWHALPIPPPVRKDVGFLLAEVERLTAEGVAASERRDYYAARCEQQERDHARQTERLKAAEDVCVMFSWSPTRSTGTDREKATHELWRRWADIVGDDFIAPEAHPDLSDEEVARLAAQRDEVRARTLAKIRGERS